MLPLCSIKMQPQRIIAHFDLDSFFVSVEILNDPSLKGKIDAERLNIYPFAIRSRFARMNDCTQSNTKTKQSIAVDQTDPYCIAVG